MRERMKFNKLINIFLIIFGIFVFKNDISADLYDKNDELVEIYGGNFDVENNVCISATREFEECIINFGGDGNT